MRRKIIVIILAMSIFLANTLIYIHDENIVVGDEQEEEGEIDYGSISVENDFVWERVQDFCNVTYDADWSEENNIPKGRAWGTAGENFTIDNILLKYMPNSSYCGLTGVTELPIKYVNHLDHFWKEYSSTFITKDFQLTIYNHTNEPYIYSQQIPKTEVYPIPMAFPHYKGYGYNHYCCFENASIYNLTEFYEDKGFAYPFAGTFTGYSINITYDALNFQGQITVGIPIYIENVEDIPEEQDGMLFIIDEEDGCEEKIDNITNATGCVLIYDDSRGYTFQNSSNYSFPILRTDYDDNYENITNIIEMLENETWMIADNYLQNGYTTFTYNFSEACCIPENDWFFIKYNRAPSVANGAYEDIGELRIWTGIYWYGWNLYNCLNGGGESYCLGFILYDYTNTHFMTYAVRRWNWFGLEFGFSNPWITSPALPIFSINNSVGEWLNDHTLNTKISGYLDQEYKQQTSGSPGVESHNVVGYRNTTMSPEDKITIISNRMDGFWGQTSGDSGVGGAIVLGVAKYMNDYKIMPKYNLTFLFTTGEEYGMRGAQHYYDTHSSNNYNFNRWIGTDQMGFKQDDTVLYLTYNDTITHDILFAILNDTEYKSRTVYDADVTNTVGTGGTEFFVWNKSKDCDAICFNKGGDWDMYHRAGENYNEGDVLNNIDRDDVNVSFELFWNVTKYFTVDPDCWFQSYSETILDSPDDEDTLNDSIKATFTVKSILPNDKAMVNATLKNTYGVIVNQTFMNFAVNRTGAQESVTLTLPGYEPAGDYMLYLELYNSTGRINDIVKIVGNNYNDTTPDPGYKFLYPFNTPAINDTSCNPSIVGFGFNVTISVNVTGVNLVKVNITYPDMSSENYTMSAITAYFYQYNFSDTWQHGMYNYTIWAYSSSGGSTSSPGHSFNVSANATINVVTLKDVYGEDEFINVTDPPNPLGDYYIVDRGLTWDKYYNASTGMNTLMVSQGPVNYQDETGVWTPINCSINMLENNHIAYGYGYRAGNEHGLYNVYFKPNAQDVWPVVFAYNKSTNPLNNIIRSKLVGVGYLDPTSDWSYEILQNVQNSQGQITGNSLTFENIFTGTDMIWSYGNTGLKEEIIMSNTTKTLLQGHPPSDYGLSNQGSYLVFITKLDYSGLNMYNTSGMLTGNFTVSDGGIDFKDVLGEFKCAMPLGEAYELYDDSVRQSLVYRIIEFNGNFYLLSGLKLVDLNNMSFPVVIDPTLTVTSLSSDGYIYASSTNYNTAWTASSGTVSGNASYISIGQNKVSGFPSTYYIYRGFLMFNTTELPLNSNITNATLQLYKKDDYSITDFIITLQNGQPLYPHIPLHFNDYDKSHYSGCGGELNTSNFVNGTNNITINDIRWIQKGGITKFCLRSSRDISGTAPTGNEYVNVYSSDAPFVPDGYLPKLIITYYNQSKIKNTGSTNISGYLLMQVHFYNEMQVPPGWVVANNTINETTPRIINVGQQFGLDTVFNNLVNTSDLLDLFGRGTYRVYAAFRDPDGNILQCDDDSLLEAWYEFTVT